MKKIFCILLVIFHLFPLLHVEANDEDDNYFVVTAYYSPLPDQEYYITGNYEAELRLNGQGIAGASGKGVFSGMLAAPAKYGFGTKIYLDGLGIGAVEDRGGAIVPAGERGYSYDRIDVWMGYGDEGLLRANFWGKRKVYGYVVDSGNATSIDYKNVPAPSWATTGLQKVNGVTTVNLGTPVATVEEIVEEIPTAFSKSLGKGSNSENIIAMQEVFVELGYLAETSGIYDETTISAVYDFQTHHEILSSEDDLGAGYYGPKTRTKLQEVYQAYHSEQEKTKRLIQKIEDIETKSLEKAEQYVESLESPSYGQVSYEVRELQKILQQLGYFEQKDTAIFGNITKESITQYQLDNDVVSGEEAQGSGIFGPKTQESMIKTLSNIYFHEYLSENELEEFYTQYASE